MKRYIRLGVVVIAMLLCLVARVAVSHPTSSMNHGTSTLQKDRSAGELFAHNCATCHGKDGQSKTFKAKFNHARDLADPAWQAGVTDERLFNSISNGKGKMPAWSKKFSEAEINALVTYVRGLKR